MRFFKFFRYDFVNGILKAWKKYLISTASFVFICWDFLARSHALFPAEKRTLGDLGAYVFAGMQEYVPGPDEPFRFPAMWLLLFVFPLYITLYYAEQDLQGFGRYTLLHSGGRGLWWFSKCAWNACAVAVYFALLWLVFAAFASSGYFAWSLRNTPHIWELLRIESSVLPPEDWRLEIRLLLLPLLVCMAMSQCQMTLSLFLKPIFSFGCSVIGLMASAYYFSPFLLGNYTMLLRGREIRADGMHVQTGILFAALLLFIGMAVGCMAFLKYDILNREDDR